MTTHAQPPSSSLPPASPSWSGGALLSPPDVAALAARLLPRAKTALAAVSPANRPAILRAISDAIDGFLVAPAPSTFVRALRLIESASRRALLEGPAAAALRRSFDEGVSALRAVPALPTMLVDELMAVLPRDARAGRRLKALATMAAAYHALGSRVAADADQRRRRWTGLPRRRPRPRI